MVKKHGKGTLRYANGNVSERDWKNCKDIMENLNGLMEIYEEGRNHGKWMEEGYTHTQMMLPMKVNGKIEKRMEKEYSNTLMELSMMENEKMVKGMEKESLNTLIEQPMIENWKME